MSHLLFLTQVLPYPLVGGAKIRAYYMLRHLAQRRPITLVSFTRDDDKPEDIAHLRQFCHAVYTVPIARSRLKDGLALLESVLTGQPAVIIRDRVPAMQTLLSRLLQSQRFDIAHADQTAMAQYALGARRHQPGLRLVLDQHNALYQLVQRQAQHERTPWQRLIWQHEAQRLVRYESDLCRQFDHILTVTEEDRRTLLGLLPAEEVADRAGHFTAVPICVDPQAQSPVPAAAEGNNILHLGTMFWPPNVEGVLWFAEKVLPLIVAQIPDAHFVIAGKNPPPAVTSLATPGAPLHEHVTVTGFVADPLPLLSQASAFVVPLMAGSGMRVKIVDGWQWGLPLVSTTIGAEGIMTRPGENILIADEPEAFATAVVRLLTDRPFAQRLRANGRRWVEERYNWRTVYNQLDAVYDKPSG